MIRPEDLAQLDRPGGPPDPPAGLLDAVLATVRRRRRRRAGVALSAVAVLAIGSSVTAVSLGGPGNQADQVATVIQTSPPPGAVESVVPSALPATASPCAAPTHVPTYRPLIVSAVTVLCTDSAVPMGNVADREPTVHYALKGKANADTIPTGTPQSAWSQADIYAGRIHGPTEILFRSWNTTKLEPALTGGTSIREVKLSDGVNARLTEMASGLGPVRVEGPSMAAPTSC